MLQELADESENQGLEINKSKTKVIMENDTPILCPQHSDRERRKLHLLGTEIQHQRQKPRQGDSKKNHTKHRDIFEGNFVIYLKRQVCTSCVLPAMTYGAETLALTTQAKNKLAAAQTNTERSMLNIAYRDRKANIWVIKKTNVIGMIEQVRRQTWIWAGHVSRIRDNRWTLCSTTWKRYERKRPSGRPARRWRDELDG